MKQTKETITPISIHEIQPFPNHPFRVEHDAAMERLIESIREEGVVNPAIVRPLPDGGYEMISGHRRMAACKELGYPTIPAVVRKLDDDAATLMMVDANQQREQLLPSEKAFAYKMRKEALQRQKEVTGHDVPPTGDANRTAAKIGEASGESYKTVDRYIRLTELIPALLKLVDEDKLGVTPAVELSYLPTKEQEQLLLAMESELSVPSVAQAKELRKKSAEGSFTEDTPLQVLTGSKSKVAEKLTIPMEQLSKFFGKGETPAQMIKTIIAALEREKRRQRNRQQER